MSLRSSLELRLRPMACTGQCKRGPPTAAAHAQRSTKDQTPRVVLFNKAISEGWTLFIEFLSKEFSEVMYTLVFVGCRGENHETYLNCHRRFATNLAC
eukprot:s172_g10.t1